MLSTAVSILAAIALLMPGFIIAELGARSPRSSRSSDSPNKRLQEGALSALKTPVNPPAPPKLVPLEKAATNGGKSK